MLVASSRGCRACRRGCYEETAPVEFGLYCVAIRHQSAPGREAPQARLVVLLSGVPLRLPAVAATYLPACSAQAPVCPPPYLPLELPGRDAHVYTCTRLRHLHSNVGLHD